MTSNEPAVAGGAIIGLAQTVLALLAAFGVHLTLGQTGALNGALVVLTAVIVFLVRAQVTPNANVPAATFDPSAIVAEARALVESLAASHYDAVAQALKAVGLTAAPTPTATAPTATAPAATAVTAIPLPAAVAAIPLPPAG